MKKKFMDENGRFFGKISVVDILVVLLVIGLAAMVYLRFFSGQESNISQPSGIDIPYTIQIPQVRQYTVDALQVGDALYNAEDGTYIGDITAVSAEPATKMEEGLDGEVLEMDVEDYYKVTINVTAKGTESSGRYYASRAYELNVNAELKFVTKYVSSTGFIESIG